MAHLIADQGLGPIMERIFGDRPVEIYLNTARWSAGQAEAEIKVFAPDRTDEQGWFGLHLQVSLADLIGEHLEANANLDRLLPHGPSMALRDALLREAARIEATVASYKA